MALLQAASARRFKASAAAIALLQASMLLRVPASFARHLVQDDASMPTLTPTPSATPSPTVPETPAPTPEPTYSITANEDGTCDLDCAASSGLEWWSDVFIFSSLDARTELNLLHLGWNDESWDSCFRCFRNHWSDDAERCVLSEYVGQERNPLCPFTELMMWKDLSDGQMEAASSLGYTPELWDAGTPYSCCQKNPLAKLPDEFVSRTGLAIGPS